MSGRSSATEIFRGLDASQARAVRHDRGPALVVAGPGTGKTRVLTHRIAHLIASRRAKPSEILALTFTERAAQEMESRVDTLVPYGFQDAWIGTFHAFGEEVLRREFVELAGWPEEGPLASGAVLTPAQAVALLRARPQDLLSAGIPARFHDARSLRILLEAVSRLQDEDIAPEEFSARISSLPEDMRSGRLDLIYRFYLLYERIKKEEGRLDFGDQILRTLRLFRARPDVLRKYQARFRHILVDEFQDTNTAQFRLVRLLAEEAESLFVVGDDDQSIFRFRGACLANILEFRQAWPKAKVIVLNGNYRSQPEILIAARRLIRHNPDRLETREKISKRLVPKSRPVPGAGVRSRWFPTLAQEAAWVAEEVEARIAAGVEPGEIAILVRANDHARPFLAALRRRGLPAIFSGEGDLRRRPEVRALLALARTLADPHDSISFLYLAQSFLWNIAEEEIAWLTDRCRRTGRSCHEILSDPAEKPGPALSEMQEALARYRSAARRTAVAPLLHRVLSERGVLTRLADGRTEEEVRQAQALAWFFEKCAEPFDQTARYGHLEEFVQEAESLLAEEEPLPERLSARDQVWVLTVHKAKGLEFREVFLVGLAEGWFPSQERGDPFPLPPPVVPSQEGVFLAEERRLFYVAMTRARERLVLTGSADVGGRRLRKPSRFIAEALGSAPSAAAPTPAGLRLPLPAPEKPLRIPPAAGLLRLRATAVDDYLTCPLKYYYAHLQRLPLRRSWRVVYGEACHQALAAFHLSLQAGLPLSEEQMLTSFRRAWRSEGFLSRAHEDRLLEQGRQALVEYRRLRLASGFVPTEVEKPFRLRLGDLEIVGRWDLLERRPEGWAIVDFKSSSVEEEPSLKNRAKDSLQLALYSLALEAAVAERPVSAELYFLESQTVSRHRPDEKWLARAREKAFRAAEGIRRGEFEPTPSAFACGFCAYRALCPATAVPSEAAA